MDVKLETDEEYNRRTGPSLPTTTVPLYVMFGTFKAEVKTLEFTADGIQVTNVPPNSQKTKSKYHLMIPYNDMQIMQVCTDPNQPMVVLKPNKDSCDKIQKSLYLGTNSENKLRFDINSEHPREHMIVMILREKITERFTEVLFRHCKAVTIECECEIISSVVAKLLLQRAQTRPESPKPVRPAAPTKTVYVGPFVRPPVATTTITAVKQSPIVQRVIPIVKQEPTIHILLPNKPAASISSTVKQEVQTVDLCDSDDDDVVTI